MRLSGAERSRVAVLGGVVAIVVVAAVLLLRGGDSYTVNARFADAGQLVKGSLIEVAGQTIGTVGEIDLADNGQANIELKISDEDYDPLPRGTVARIRTVGLSGVANRYLDLTLPKGGGADIPDGGVLTTNETRAVVDLDEVLNDLDLPTRTRLQRIIANGAKIYGGDGTDANKVLAYLNPALGQTRVLADDITKDAMAVDRLLTSSSQVLGVLSRRRGDVEGAVVNTAATLRSLAGERAALQSSLEQAPGVLNQAQGTLSRLRGTLSEVRPAIRELRPSAKPLADTLRATVPAARAVDPVAARIRQLLPVIKQGLDGLPGLARDGNPALVSTTEAVRDAMPIFAGLRPYASDIVNGLFLGFGGAQSAGYDANGHFARITPTVGANGAAGLLSLLGSLPSGSGYRSGVLARCPGAATQTAPDGSNPYTDDPDLCRAQDSPR